MVIDFKKDLSLLVINAGKSSGVNIGMPYKITRDGKILGYANVVDARDNIAGAVIQNLVQDNIEIKRGDTLQVNSVK